MPFVRCKFYSESGEPLRGGCRRKGAGCAFVHPGDSDWTHAPPPSFKARDKSGDSRGFKSLGERGKHGAVTHLAWGTGGNASTSSADTGGGWGTGSGWGDWDAGGDWGTGGGWDMGGSTSTSIQVPESTQLKSPSTVQPRDSSTLLNKSQAGVVPPADEGGRGGSADKATGPGWGSHGNDEWGASSWGENKDTNKPVKSTWGNAPNDEWGAGWGEIKDTGSSWGNARNDGWGAGWGDNKDMGDSWSVSDSMAVDSQAEKKTEQNKGKSKAVPAPPRIRIPDKKAKTTGTNKEPLGTSKWGESRGSNLPTTSNSVTVSTPVTAFTPTEPSRVKRKRDVSSDDKPDGFKEYVKAWERGVRARFMLEEAEAKRDRWFCTQKSACYARIGEAGRERLDGQRAEYDKEVDLQRDKLSAAITSLIGFHDTISSNLDLGQRYSVGEETKTFIVESKVFVDEVRTLLVKHVLKGKNDMQSGDVCKRSLGSDAISIDTLQSRVRNLEERFDQAQAELTLRHQRGIRSEINGLLSEKVSDLRVARQREIDRVASQPRPEIVIPPSALKKIEAMAQQVRELDVKVPHTVEDIRVLLLRVDATTKRVSELEEKLSVNKETHRKMQEMTVEQEIERKVNEQLEKIREKYEQLVQSRSCGPAEQPATSPTTWNSQDKLMESLRPILEAVLDKFYEREVRPTIASLQQVIIEASDHHQEEAIKVLWGKIQPAMNMVAGVSRWLDSQELGLTAPASGGSDL